MTNEKTLWQDIELRLKDTVGYSECVNKQSYMVGARSAVSFAFELLNKQIEFANKNNEYLKNQEQLLREELQTIASIIKKHSEY